MTRTIRGTIDLAPSTEESLKLDVLCDVDPTGELPEFMLTAKGARDAVGTWVAGAWASAYDAATDTAVALTPIVGVALPITSGVVYDLWLRLDVGNERPVFRVGTVSVT